MQQVEQNPLYSDLIEWLEPQGYSFFRIMPDGSLSAIQRFIFTWGLVTHVDWDRPYKHRWCYPELHPALLALAQYPGEGDPLGPWIKYKGQGPERHNPKMHRMENGLYKRIPDSELAEAGLWQR